MTDRKKAAPAKAKEKELKENKAKKEINPIEPPTESIEPSFRQAAVAWALALASGADVAAARGVLDRAHGPLGKVAHVFGLTVDEQLLLTLLYARERSFELGELVCGPTVERARRLLGAHVDGLLAPLGALRRHALVEAGAASSWWAADERLRLGRGLAARFDGEPEATLAVRDGVTLVTWPHEASWAMRFPPSAQLLNVVPRALNEPQLHWLSACPRKDAVAFAVELSERARRNLLMVDGAQLGPDAGALAALRRDAELDDALVVVSDVSAVGEAWHVLCRAPAAQPGAPLSITLADARPAEAFVEPAVLAPLRPRQLVLLPTPEKPEKIDTLDAAKGAGALADPGLTGSPDDDNSFDEIRKRAQRDAERALGVWKETYVRHPIPPPKKKPVVVAPVGYEQSLAAMQGAPAEKAPPPEPVAVAPVPEVEKVEKSSVAPEKPKEAPPRAAEERYSPKAMQFIRKKHLEAAAAAAPPPPVDNPVAGVDFPPSGIAPLPLPEKAGPVQWSQLAQTSPSPEQRIELLGMLRAYKGSEVVAALRANAKSEHPGVRAAAEAGMQALFGASWNQTRAVPKPVQPPRSSDDDDRGPPGGLGGR